MSEVRDLDREFQLRRRAKLLQILATRFDEGELHTLCFGLGVDYGDLPESGKANKARALIAYLERHDRIAELVEFGRQLRPDIPWDEVDRVADAVSLPSMKTPHNLPHALGGFVGRTIEMAELAERVEGRWPVICIEGIGGIGKTSLVIETAHAALERKYFEGIVWTTAKNRKLVLNDLLDTIARTLDYENLTRLPEDDKLSAIRRLLRTGRYLVIVDNFETIEDERVLQFAIEIPAPSKVLITSRQVTIPSAWLIRLKGLPRDEALTLIRREAERLDLDSIVQASDLVLSRLYEGTGGVPLAIKWSLGQIRQKGQTLERVLSNLYHARGDVFETIFSRSFEMLTFGARQVLRSLLVFSSSASRGAIAAVSGIDEYELDEALGQLVEMLLVDVVDLLSPSGARYDLHPLTRAFAHRQLVECDSLKGYDDNFRLARYFLSFVKDHMGATERSENYRALGLEHANIFAALNWCYETGRDVEVERLNLWRMFIEFSNGLADYLWARGYWAERVDICQRAFEACKFLEDWNGAGRQAYAIGWVYWEQGNVDMAQSWSQKCQEAMEKADRPEGLSLAKHLLGLVAIRRGEYEKAKLYFMDALDLVPPDRVGVGGKGSIMSELGHVYRLQGKLEEAKGWYEKCVAESEKTAFAEGVGISKGYLARTLFLMGQAEQAEALYREALQIILQVGRATTLARIHHGLAEILLQREELAEAREHAWAAVPIYERLEKSKELEAVRSLLAQIEARQVSQ